MKHTKDERGIAFILEIVLVAVILAVVGFAVYASMQAKKTSSTTPTASASVTPTPNPYPGWNSYTTKNEKIAFKYPSNWILKDSTSKDNNVYEGSGRLIYSPGTDILKLTAPTGLVLELSAGAQRYGGDSPVAKVISSTPVSLLGQTYYLNYVSDNTTMYKESVAAQIAKSATTQAGSIPAKNIKIGPGATNNPAIQDVPDPIISIQLWYGQTNSEHYPVSKFQNDAEYANALKILQSMAY